MFSFLHNFIIHEDNVLEYTDKFYAAKGKGVRHLPPNVVEKNLQEAHMDIGHNSFGLFHQQKLPN